MTKGQSQGARLSPLQIKLMQHAAAGLNRTQIARVMEMSRANVGNNIDRIMDKLLAPEGISLAELVEMARKQGYDL